MTDKQEEAARNVREAVALEGEKAIYAIFPVAEKLTLITNGLTVEQSIIEAQNPSTIDTLDEFIATANSFSRIQLIGALYYSAPALVKEVIRAEMKSQ